MYRDYFGLSGVPFSIAPDPRYLYMSSGHREALAHLLYGTQGGGFVMLSGAVGTGKTTVCRCFLEQLPEHCDVALILNPLLTAVELLAAVRDELGAGRVAEENSPRLLVDSINQHLLRAHARGRTTLLLIDEAQNLRLDVLEQLRLLTNLETNEKKLLQILLVGQPELQTMLSGPAMRQVAQRITARYHLCALPAREVGHYVSHRLQVAGCHRPLFSAAALRRLARLSGGVPRLINVICDRALLAAYSERVDHVNEPLLRRAATEVLPPSPLSALRWPRWGAVATLIACAISLAWFAGQRIDGGQLVATPDSVPIPPLAVTELVTASAAAVEASRSTAYSQLFALWGLDYQEQRDGAPCDYARHHALRCLSGVGGFDELRHADRPAVLRSFSWQGQGGLYALWEGLDEHGVSLQVGNRSWRLDMERAKRVLRRDWGGEYSLLWRPPEVYRGTLNHGGEGPLVTWLAHQRALLEGGASVMPERLEGELLVWARQLQSQIGHGDDHAIGPEVLIHLNNMIGTEAPRLREWSPVAAP